MELVTSLVEFSPFLILFGFLDAFNICTISLFALLISLLFSTNTRRINVITSGLSFIGGLFVAYFLTGLGILLIVVDIPGAPHFFSQAAVLIMIVFGTFNVINYLKPGLIPTVIPNSLAKKSVDRMQSGVRAGVRAGGFISLGIAGVLAGLHNFPCACTAGVYMTFLGAVAGNPLQFFYILLYNLLFITPFLLILLFLSNKRVTVRFRKSYENNKAFVKYIMGLIMIALGTIIALTLFFTG